MQALTHTHVHTYTYKRPYTRTVARQKYGINVASIIKKVGKREAKSGTGRCNDGVTQSTVIFHWSHSFVSITDRSLMDSSFLPPLSVCRSASRTFNNGTRPGIFRQPGCVGCGVFLDQRRGVTGSTRSSSDIISSFNQQDLLYPLV